jgi:hypothetical protein
MKENLVERRVRIVEVINCSEYQKKHNSFWQLSTNLSFIVAFSSLGELFFIFRPIFQGHH